MPALRLIVLYIFFIIPAFPVYADDQAPANDPSAASDGAKPVFSFDFPILDFPYQSDAARTKGEGRVGFVSYLEGFESPSMEQSLALTTDFYRAGLWGIDTLFGYKPNQDRDTSSFLRYMGYSACQMALVFLGAYCPPGSSWLHEEFHRAIMSSNDTDSFNMVYTFPFFKGLIAVNRVSDDDLIRFKASNPADFIRMHTAGIEGEYILIERLQRGNFFDGQDLPIILVSFSSTFSSSLYVSMCSGLDVDYLTEKLNARETDIAVRDFTGFDFLGWVYDLFRPDEAYTERGAHPSGLGIDRYIKTTDLDAEELSYLRVQGYLSYLNFISPMIYTSKNIRLDRMFGREAYGNFALRHFLTASGSDSALHVYLKDSEWKTAWALHNYVNRQSWFPAIEAELVEKEIELGRVSLLVSPRLILGMQPRGQEFRTTIPAFFCFFRVDAELRTGLWASPTASLEYKTAGWVAGNEYTAAKFSINAGLKARF